MAQKNCYKCNVLLDFEDKFCKQCGTTLEGPSPTIPAEIRKDDSPASIPEPANIPDDAVIVRQSNWAWMWSTVPWVALFGVAMFFVFLFSLLPSHHLSRHSRKISLCLHRVNVKVLFDRERVTPQGYRCNILSL